jgi:hypothetical protein
MTIDSPASILYDNTGNPVGVVLDGATYRLRVESTIPALSGSFSVAQFSVPNGSSAPIPSSITGRKTLSIKCQIGGSSGIFIGPTSAVTASGAGAGYGLFNGDTLDLDIDESVTVYAIANAVGAILHVLELG